MKKISICLTILCFNFLMMSCKKDEVVSVTPTEVTPGLTALLQGSFTSSAHATSGTVKLSKDAAGKKFLVFENFKTDAGPDLRIYLSDDVKATNYTEITNKVTVSGSYQLPVDGGVDTEKKRKVLIWCQQFSVLFGSADLK